MAAEGGVVAAPLGVWAEAPGVHGVRTVGDTQCRAGVTCEDSTHHLSAALPPVDDAPPPLPPPRVDASERAWLGALAAGGATCLTFGLVDAVAVGVVAAAAAPILALTAQAGFQADPTACMAVACLVIPMQSAVTVMAGLVGATVAAGSAWLANALVARRRMATVPACVAVAVPTLSVTGLATVLGGVLTCGNCCATTCAPLMFASFLVDRYEWQMVNAEYYAQRRCAPLVFYGCFALTEVALVATVVSGNAVSAALVTGWAGLSGRPTLPEESALEPDLFVVPDPEAPVLEVGAYNENGTARALFPQDGYVGIDIRAGVTLQI